MKNLFAGPEIYKIVLVSVACVWATIYKEKNNLVLLPIRTCYSAFEADMKLELFVKKNNIEKCKCGVISLKPEGDA